MRKLLGVECAAALIIGKKATLQKIATAAPDGAVAIRAAKNRHEASAYEPLPATDVKIPTKHID